MERMNKRESDEHEEQHVSVGSLNKKAHEMPRSCGAISCPHKHCSTHGSIERTRARNGGGGQAEVNGTKLSESN